MNVLENSKLVFFVFILLGFIMPWYADEMKIMLIPLLILMMIFSIKGVHLGHINKNNYKRVLKLNLINYFVLSPLIILLSFLFIKNQDYRAGFVILAAVPPAIGIIPLVHLYKGDIKDSVLGELVCFLFALLYSPLLVYIILGKDIDISYFIKILFLLLIVPLIIARLIRGLQWKIFKKKNIVINLVYGFSFYIFIGLNHKTLTTDILSLWPVAAIVIIISFVLGSVIFLLLRFKKVKIKEDIMYVLFGTFKNGNTAATISIFLFGPAAAIPVAVRGLLTPFYFVFLEWLFKRHSKAAAK